MRLADRLRELDNRVMGRPIPEDRPLVQQLMRSRSVVWSGKGRLLYGAVLLGMLLAFGLGGPVIGAVAVPVFFGLALMTSFSEERKRSKRFYDHSDE